MRRRVLNDEQQAWLYANYRDMETPELVKILTKKVNSENQKEAKRLRSILPNLAGSRFKKSVERDVIFYEKEVVISEDSIRRYACKLGCPHKSPKIISQQNRIKAKKTNTMKWNSKAETVIKILPWLRTFRLNEVRIVKAKDDTQMRSFPPILSNWNASEGVERNFFLSANYDKENMLIRVQSYRSRTSQ